MALDKHTLVDLFDLTEKFSNSKAETYINANYIDVHPKNMISQNGGLPAFFYFLKQSPFGDEKRTFIATQGPKKETYVHFWRMVYMDNVNLTVTLCPSKENGKVKMELAKLLKAWKEVGSQRNAWKSSQVLHRSGNGAWWLGFIREMVDV